MFKQLKILAVTTLVLPIIALASTSYTYPPLYLSYNGSQNIVVKLEICNNGGGSPTCVDPSVMGMPSKLKFTGTGQEQAQLAVPADFTFSKDGYIAITEIDTTDGAKPYQGFKPQCAFSANTVTNGQDLLQLHDLTMFDKNNVPTQGFSCSFADTTANAVPVTPASSAAH